MNNDSTLDRVILVFKRFTIIYDYKSNRVTYVPNLGQSFQLNVDLFIEALESIKSESNETRR